MRKLLFLVLGLVMVTSIAAFAAGTVDEDGVEMRPAGEHARLTRTLALEKEAHNATRDELTGTHEVAQAYFNDLAAARERIAELEAELALERQARVQIADALAKAIEAAGHVSAATVIDRHRIVTDLEACRLKHARRRGLVDVEPEGEPPATN